MFKFGFSLNNVEQTESIEEKPVVWLEANEIIPAQEIFPAELDLAKACNNFTCKSDVIIKYISNEYVLKHMKDKCKENSVIHAEKNHSDLITGVYEGGLKVWECTKDLIDFITDKQIDLKGKTVLDLGCGVGIVGIFALLNCAQVCFQDYNPEVITSNVIPNVFLNLEHREDVLNKSRFYSGDWKSFCNIMQNTTTKFDYILTSETIYNVNNYNKLHSIFVNCLEEDGVIYVAAKTYYFGVGGGLRLFEDFIAKYEYFDYSSIWMCPDGITREILKLTRKKIKA